MKTYESGNRVPGGYYLSRKRWEVVTVEGETGELKGAQGERFVKVPVPLLFVTAPLLGGLFVVFLPFIGFGMVVTAAGRKLVAATRETAGGLAETMSPGWRPGEAHLTGKEGAEGKPEHKDEVVAKLEKEVGDRRKEETK